MRETVAKSWTPYRRPQLQESALLALLHLNCRQSVDVLSYRRLFRLLAVAFESAHSRAVAFFFGYRLLCHVDCSLPLFLGVIGQFSVKYDVASHVVCFVLLTEEDDFDSVFFTTAGALFPRCSLAASDRPSRCFDFPA